MLDLYKNSFKEIEKSIGRIFSYLPITPNQYTIISLGFAFIVLYFLVKNNLILSLLFFIIAAFLDFVDGAVARFTQKSTKVGAYLDTIIDRYVEGILLFGFLFLHLPEILLSSEIWIFLCLFGSIMTTYSKAAVMEKNLATQELKGGTLSRTERLILLCLSMFFGIFNLAWMVYVLIILAIFSNFTALQRINSAIRKNVFENTKQTFLL